MWADKGSRCLRACNTRGACRSRGLCTKHSSVHNMYRIFARDVHCRPIHSIPWGIFASERLHINYDTVAQPFADRKPPLSRLPCHIIVKTKLDIPHCLPFNPHIEPFPLQQSEAHPSPRSSEPSVNLMRPYESSGWGLFKLTHTLAPRPSERHAVDRLKGTKVTTSPSLFRKRLMPNQLLYC